MRLSEKSFEIRFCASLSAALMPFNRNPQWFGLTQAQERKAGIDTMLRTGGRLIVFQFKACRKNGVTPSYLLEREQWETLSNFTKHHPKSTFYVFPEYRDIKDTNSAKCLIEKSWCAEVGQLDTFFSGNSHSTKTLTLDPQGCILYLGKSGHQIGVRTICQLFGCFCTKKWHLICFEPAGDGKVSLLFLSSELDGLRRVDEPMFPVPDTLGGIPMGQPQNGIDSQPMQSADQFEELLGERANQDLKSGLYGLFLPNLEG